MFSSKRLSGSLRARLLWQLLPPLFLLFSATGVIAYRQAQEHANRAYDHWLADSVNSLAQLVRWHDGRAVFVFPDAAKLIFEWDDTDSIYYRISGSRSGLIAGTAEFTGTATQARERRGSVEFFDANYQMAKVRLASLQVTAPSAEAEKVIVQVAETLHKRNELASELLRDTLIPLLVLILVAVLVVWVALSRALGPVRNVAETLEAQTHHSLDQINDESLPTEVRPLTQAMNKLLLRLAEALDAQRKFITDAAHQLRTPLTALKLHADDAVRETSLEGALPIMRQVQAAADRAVHLSNQLLLLARAEPVTDTVHFVEFDLRRVVFEAGSVWVPQSLDSGIDLGFVTEAEVQDTTPMRMRGDPVMLAEAIHNLLDNALKYAGSGARVTLTLVRADAQRALISVDDNGPGIPAHERQAVLQRFFRGDSSQSNPTDVESGSGLGLAIVREVVQTHGGELTIENGSSGRGVCISLTLPLI